MSNNPGYAKGHPDHAHQPQLTRKELKRLKRDEAAERADAYSRRPPETQIEYLRNEGHGNCSEARLLEELLSAS